MIERAIDPARPPKTLLRYKPMRCSDVEVLFTNLKEGRK